MKAYKCDICKMEFNQRSHYKRHINKKNLCLSKDELIDKIKEGKLRKGLILKKPDGTIIWSREKELKEKLLNESNTESENLKNQFDSLIKQCHQIEYNNGAIVGKDAMTDIMKLLTLKLLQPLFKDKGCLKKKYDEYYEKQSDNMKKKLDKHYEQCIDLNIIANSGALNNEWKNLVNNLLSKIIQNIYDTKDNNFNGNDKAIKLIIQKIEECTVFSKLTKEKDGIKHYDSISGQIYEYFMNKYVNGGGKELGQFFTPRYMIDMIVYGLNIEKYIKIDSETTVYDPCTGSGGFLTRIYNCFPELNPENIYGCEIEKDTIKFCISNMLLTTSNFCENLINDNSIVYEDNKQHNMILTNPPFGTSMKYGQHNVKEGGKNIKKDGLMEEYNNKYPEGERETEFEDIYPVKTNDGACLFTQKCIHKLKKNGLLSIVLPDGQLFFGKNFRKFRKWLSEKMNIRYIVQAPSGTFEHAGIKTCVIMATKDGETEKIQFLKTDKGCSYLEKIVEIDSDDLMLGEYSLDPKEYLEDEYLSKMMDGSCVEWKMLGDICDKIEGGRAVKKENRTGGEYPYYGANGHISDSYMNKYLFDGKYIICAQDGSIGSTYLVDCKFWPNNHTHILSIQNDVTRKYTYYNLIYMVNYQKVITGIIPKLNQENLKKIKIPLPSLEIQQKIVTELDQLESHTKTLKELLEHTKKAKEMYQRYGMIKEIRELLNGCEWKALGYVCEFSNGKNITKDKLIEGKYPVVGGGKTPLGYHNDFNVDKNTIIISKDGAYAGFVSRYDKKVFVSNHGIYIDNIDKNVKQNYIYYYFKLLLQEKLFMLQTGSAQPGVNKKDIEKLQIPLPSLEIQQSCIKVYQQKEAKLQEYDKEIEKIENDIKHNQELGKQVIEYYITVDAHPTDTHSTQLIEQESDNDESNDCLDKEDDSEGEELVNLKKIKKGKKSKIKNK